MSSVKELLRGDVIDGSGTADYIPKWSDSNTLTDSLIEDDGTTVSVGGGLTVQGQVGNPNAGAFTINASNAAGTIALRVAGATRANIVPNGIQMPTGLGIDFSASEGGGATSSLLDDYEEGTWTPTYTASGGGAPSGYASQEGHYTKIGNVVTIRFVIRSNKDTLSGDIKVSGLPFTAVVGTITIALTPTRRWNTLFSVFGSVFGTDISLFKEESNASGVATEVADTDMLNTSTFYNVLSGTFTYYV
jgi:hypothetical protein